MKKYLIGAILLLGMALYVLSGEYIKQRQKNVVQERNITALTSTMKFYKTKSGKAAYQIQGLELNLRTFKKLYSSVYNEAADLKVKLKNATGVIQVITEIKYKNKDSIVYVPFEGKKKYLVRDSLISADVIITKDSVIEPSNFIINEIKNKTTIVPTIEYKGWWLWKKPKSVNLSITNTNPFVNITNAVYIDLTKK